MRFWVNFILLFALLIGVTACGQTQAVIPLAANQPAAPAVAAPTVAEPAQPEPIQAAPSLAAPSQAEPSPTAVPILEPTVVIPTPTNTTAASAPAEPTPASAACTNQAELLSKTVYPPNDLVAGQTFSLVWQFKNIGTCTWTAGYTLVLVGGEQLGQFTSAPLPNPVQPGETVIISYNQSAPNHYGDMVQAWILQDESGNRFGLGAQGQEAFVIPFTVRSLEAPKNPMKGRDPCF